MADAAISAALARFVSESPWSAIPATVRHEAQRATLNWLACALGHKACRDDLSVLYYRVPRLFAALSLARGDGRYSRLLRQIAKANLLILDDWGPEPLLPEQARDLLEVIEDRYDAGSTLITSQVPVDRWYEIIGIPTLADAVLDRLLHNAHRIELTGESLRKRKAAEPAA